MLMPWLHTLWEHLTSVLSASMLRKMGGPAVVDNHAYGGRRVYTRSLGDTVPKNGG